MLVHLHVKNLALIDEIEVEFGPGLNILTGETGAGKSILLGSMQLILGGKTSRSMIRENAPYALVELLFQVENRKAKEALAALDTCFRVDCMLLLHRSRNRIYRALAGTQGTSDTLVSDMVGNQRLT